MRKRLLSLTLALLPTAALAVTVTEIVPCNYDGTFLSGNFVKVYVGNDPDRKYGLFDITGKEILPCMYEDVANMDQGLIAGKLNGKWGFINQTGKEIVPCMYENAWSCGQDLIAVKQNGKSGFIDQMGKEVTPCQYEGMYNFSEGLAAVKLNGKCGLFDKTGNEIVPCKYSSIDSLSEGLMHVELSDGGRTRHGYIDTMGKEVIPCKYLWAKDFKGGRALVGVDNGEKDEDGYLVGTEVTIDRTGAQIDGVMIKRGGEEQNWKWGFVDAKGREIVPYKYTSASDFSGRFANVGIDGKWGLLTIDDYVDLTVPAAPANLAYASTQSVLVDGSPVEFQAYALKDANGNDTNYIKLRDVASVLNGTAVQFNVGWDGAVNMETGKAYIPNGSEMMTPFSGDRAYETATAETRINGVATDLSAIVLKDDQGGAYTYYKLRDLGTALGFRVDWLAEKGIFIETK